MIRICASLIVLLLAACQTQPEPAPAPQRSNARAPAIERPTIELAGCRHVEPGRCTLEAGATGRLRVWIDVQPRAPVRVTIDGLPIEPARVAVDGGQLLRIEVPEQAELLRINGAAPAWATPFELRIDREQIPSVVTRADELARADDPNAAIELLRKAEPDFDGVDRLALLQQLRRVLGSVDPYEALRRSEQAAELARALGRNRDFADCASQASLTALLLGDLVRARHWAGELERIAPELPEAKVWARYYNGVLAARTGDLDAAVRSLHEASRLSLRLDMLRELLAIDEVRAAVLAELGRADEALQITREIVARLDDPSIKCSDRARARGNVAWINLVLAEAGHLHDPPRPLLEQQLKAVSEGGECPDPSTPALVNLAIVALAEHEPEEAWEWILAQRAIGVPPYLRVWVDEIEAQVGVASGRLELVPPVVRRPDPGGQEPGLRWMAIVRHAQTLATLGLREPAIDTYLEAEAVLEETFRSVGVDTGRELFLAGRRASAEGLIELLLAQGDIDAAFCRARLARARALQTVDRMARIAGLSPEQRTRRDELLYSFLAVQDELALERRDDWEFSAAEQEHRKRRRAERAAEAAKLLDEALRLVGGRGGTIACDQLPAMIPGEITILQFPRPDEGSWIFVADEHGTSVASAPDPSSALEPFAERIIAAQRIRVLPTGSGWSVPFHALSLGDGVLLDHAPVVYALDLPARAPRASALDKALVVANPSEDLPYAEREAEEVVQRLTAAGWKVERYLEAEASRAQLTEGLADAAMLHYAGHGTHGGVDGWGAAMLLHDGDRLGVADILALPRVPDTVVLSGCNTATVDHDTLAGGMNLSRAFVLAGARWVIAADGEVDDDLARAMGVALYEAMLPKDDFDGAEALRRAQLQLRERHPDRWQAFRVVVP